jgi:hypothetical protein
MRYPFRYFPSYFLLIPIGPNGPQIVKKLCSYGTPEPKGDFEPLEWRLLFIDIDHKVIDDIDME